LTQVAQAAAPAGAGGQFSQVYVCQVEVMGRCCSRQWLHSSC
jgi:hypothetical protein